MEMARWAFAYPHHDSDSVHSHDEVRSGELWIWEVESRAVPKGVMKTFAGVKQVIRCQRTIISKSTGEITQETSYALTNLDASAQDLYRYWRGHWEVENRLHHKRDVAFGEDACRSRKAAQALAALRNLIIGLLHLTQGRQVKRAVRRLQSHPRLALELLGWKSHSR
jgi:predicted transposase YbfD/YdcC